MTVARSRCIARVLVSALALTVWLVGPGPKTAASEPNLADPVVVATFDSGTNPFHPCFGRDWRGISSPRDFLPGYPASARPLQLARADRYAEALRRSRAALRGIEPETLYYVPGTNLSFIGSGPRSHKQFVDTYPHGAQASSQIACDEYGMAPNAHLVILNWLAGTSREWMYQWVAAQPWIDVVHLNIQDLPYPPVGIQPGIRQMTEAGKFVVLAAGNGVNGYGASYPMELSRYTGPRGSLIAGANDNGGWTYYSNLNPHVVMDGGHTVAASPHGYGDTSFDGTSSSSPRITGYVARLIGEARAEFGHTGKGLLQIPASRMRPTSGPLQDGVLTAAELHEVVRKTADPNSHESKYDGSQGDHWVPQPVDLPFAFYPKMGYGEVSEHTIDAAFAVLSGRVPIPHRPYEDYFFDQSEELRRVIHH